MAPRSRVIGTPRREPIGQSARALWRRIELVGEHAHGHRDGDAFGVWLLKMFPDLLDRKLKVARSGHGMIPVTGDYVAHRVVGRDKQPVVAVLWPQIAALLACGLVLITLATLRSSKRLA